MKEKICFSTDRTKACLVLLIAVTVTVFFTGCGTKTDRTVEMLSSDTAASVDRPVSGSQSFHPVVHIDGSEMMIPDHAERIAAVYGPSYEICAALGAEDRIVVAADVQFENFPWALKIWKRIKKIPYLRNVHSSVNFEELQKYSPDLVLTFNRPNEINQLRKAGIPVVNGLTPRSLEDEKRLMMVYSDALGGDAPERAQRYCSYFDEKLQSIKEITDYLTDEERPSVYYAGVDLLTTYGNQSDIVEVIEAAGGTPVMMSLNAGNHTAINYEQLTSWNPEFIFIDHGGMNDRETVEDILEGTEKNRRYQSVSAVKNHKMFLVPSGTFYWDMGIQKILLIEYIADILHPDLFADLDMKEELKEFYSTFFEYNLTDDEAERILKRKDPV